MRHCTIRMNESTRRTTTGLNSNGLIVMEGVCLIVTMSGRLK